MFIDIEDRPSDRHGVLAQMMNGCCIDLESLVASVDHGVISWLNGEVRMMGSYATNRMMRRVG